VSDDSQPHPFSGPEEEGDVSGRLNWVRAGVLGANDGIVSIAALVVGVAAATTDDTVIATAGLAGLAAGALSMGVGEYVSVSSQRDAEQAQLARERVWQEARPEWEHEQLVRLNMDTGMSEDVARAAATQQMEHDALGIHARMHLGVDPDELTNPWSAGAASLVAFTVGGLGPLLTILWGPLEWRVGLTFAAVLGALALTGWLSARLARSPRPRAIARNMIGGAVAMVITYGIGALVGVAV